MPDETARPEIIASAEERDRPNELLAIVDACHGFGTVVICFAGSRFACSIDDLREAIRRRTDEQGGRPR